MNLYQGDQVIIGLTLKDDEGNFITPEDVQEVAVGIGTFSRKSTDAEYPVTYDAENKTWLFQVTEADSFGLVMGVHSLSARVKFTNESIGSANAEPVFVLPAGVSGVL